jgi:ATP-binding cassette subfamily C protein
MKIKAKLDFFIKLIQLFNKQEKLQFLGIMAVVLLMGLFQALGVASILPFISLVMNPEIISQNSYLVRIYDFFGFQSQRSFIIIVGIIMFLIIIVGNLISALAIVLKTRFIWRKNHKLSTDLLSKYLSLPYSYFLNQNTADLGKNVLAEVQNLTVSFFMPILEIIVDVIVISFVFLTLVIVSPAAAITALFIFAFFYGVIYKSGIRKKLKSKGKARLKANENRFKVASESLGGIKDIKVLGRESYFINKFSGWSWKYSDLQSWNTIIGSLPRYFIEAISFGGVIIFILFLLITERNFQQIIPMVSFFAFAGYRILPLVNRIFQAFAKLQFTKAVLDKIHQDLVGGECKTVISKGGSDDAGKEERFVFGKSIVLKDISFSYPGANNYVFENVNITIPKNSSVAIAGPTGTGKTTLIDIILGLLDPTHGRIMIDDLEIKQNNLHIWQKILGYVPQYIYLSDDSIKHNIAFGIPDQLIDVEKIKQVAKIANIDWFITKELSKGYDTLVGERGIRLSGGQKQRIGIARALYNNPDILVFDEATSSLDGVTEGAVLKAIENISKLKTIIVIAHRLTTVQKCDMIYLLDQGAIIAQGNYVDLMKNNAQFRAMAREL